MWSSDVEMVSVQDMQFARIRVIPLWKQVIPQEMHINVMSNQPRRSLTALRNSCPLVQKGAF